MGDPWKHWRVTSFKFIQFSSIQNSSSIYWVCACELHQCGSLCHYLICSYLLIWLKLSWLYNTSNINQDWQTISKVLLSFPRGPVVGNCLLMQGTFNPWSGRIKYVKATKPVHAPESPLTLEPMLSNKRRSHWNEKAVNCVKKCPLQHN